MSWEEAVLAVTGLVVLFSEAFGAHFWRFVENVKATGLVRDGWSGVTANGLGILFFAGIGAGLALMTGQSPLGGAGVGALVGFLVSLKAGDIHDARRAPAAQAQDERGLSPNETWMETEAVNWLTGQRRQVTGPARREEA